MKDICDHFWVDANLYGIPASRCVTCGKLVFKAVQNNVLSKGDVQKASNPRRVGDALGIEQATGKSLHEVMAEIVSTISKRASEEKDR